MPKTQEMDKFVESEGQRLLNMAVEAAKEAGALLAEYQKKGFRIDKKGDTGNPAGDIVTEADFAAQELIVDRLSKEKGISLLAEEDEAFDGSHLNTGFHWCIDPLDGTFQFAEGKNIYGPSIALVHKDGTPVLGVIYLPAVDELITAIRGHGAVRNGRPIGPRSLDSELSVIVQFGHQVNIDKLLDTLRQKYHVTVRAEPGAAYKCFKFITDSPALVIYPKLKGHGASIWDFSASSCIVREFGGIPCTYSGDAIPLNRTDTAYCQDNGIVYSPTKDIADIVVEALQDA